MLWVQNHLLYLPIIGLIGLVVAGLDHAARLLPRKFLPYGVAATTLAVALLALETRSYATVFADPEQLWSDNLQYSPYAWYPRYLLAESFLSPDRMDRDRLEQGIEQLQASAAINPDFFSSQYLLGVALNATGRPAEAIGPLQQAVRIKPGYGLAHFCLGLALEKAGRFPEATAQFETALQIDPNNPQIESYLAQLQKQQAAAPPKTETPAPPSR
jgi:tetratricopeptide (TPR) repeat protein